MTKNHTENFISLRGELSPQSHLIAVGGGKGGVGKSFVSSSLAIFLSQMGYDTVLADLDLGGANLHTTLDTGLPSAGVNDFLADENMSLEDITLSTAYRNLRLIAGNSNLFGTPELKPEEKTRLLSSLFHYKTKFLIMDLSAGTHQDTLDFLLMAPHKVLVTTPEPTSIENAYRFIKAAFFRQMKRYEFRLHLQEFMEEIMKDREKWGIRSPADLLRIISEEYPANGRRLKALMDRLEFSVVLNQGRSYRDKELAPSIANVVNKYFGVPCQLLGYLDHDNAVWQSQRKRRHLLMEYPHSQLYAQLLGMARRLVNPERNKAVV